MTSTPPHTPTKGAPVVGIFFSDTSITEIFADLLAAQGVGVRVLSSPVDLSDETRIITEPRYLPDIPTTHYGKCLIVGCPEALGDFPGTRLTRPLTEEKVEEALAAFLSA